MYDWILAWVMLFYLMTDAWTRIRWMASYYEATKEVRMPLADDVYSLKRTKRHKSLWGVISSNCLPAAPQKINPTSRLPRLSWHEAPCQCSHCSRKCRLLPRHSQKMIHSREDGAPMHILRGLPRSHGTRSFHVGEHWSNDSEWLIKVVSSIVICFVGLTLCHNVSSPSVAAC